MSDPVVKSIVLFGGIGNGKTKLMNKMCGCNFPSSGGVDSVTLHVQHANSRKHGLFVIDTPGIGASENVAEHIAAQKVAVEKIPLSGVFVVVKYQHRSADVARGVEPVMDFLGTDDVRVIVTHIDMASAEYNQAAFAQKLSDLLGIDVQNISMAGKDTPGEDIENFIQSTLHDPIQFKVSDIQIAAVASLTSVRKYNIQINKIENKIDVANAACELIVESGKTRETDLAILATQNGTTKMVADAKDEIFRAAYTDNVSIDRQT